MSSDARYVFFSSDAGGAGSLFLMDPTKSLILTTIGEIFLSGDMKSSALFNDNVQIFIDEEILSVTGYKINLNSEYPILLHGEIPAGSFQSVSLYANGRIISTSQSDRSGLRHLIFIYHGPQTELGPMLYMLKLLIMLEMLKVLIL